MKKSDLRFAIASLCLLAAAPCSAAAAPDAEPAAIADIGAEIDAAYLKFQEDSHIPGMVWGVVKDGAIVHYGQSGVQDIETAQPVSADTLFRIASMSKAFTALAILKLRDDGKLSLDAPAEKYVPELRKWTYPTSDSPRIRVRDLLSHVGGLVTDDPWGDRHQSLSEADFTKMLREGVPFSRAPQTAFEYSNLGYALLGRIITNVSQRPFDQYIMTEIMAPLGMSSTRYEIADTPPARRALGYRWENDAYAPEPVMGHGVFGAMGGVVTSANDYAKWVAFLLDAWPARDGDETGPVRRSSVRELSQGLNFPRKMSAERERENGETQCAIALAYGMGMTAWDECDLGFILSHGGGYPGYGSYVMLLPNSGVGFFAFANRTYAAPRAPMTEAALALHHAGLVPAREIPVSDALAGAYAIAGEIYKAGDLTPTEGALAMNFLMDRSAENWAEVIAELKTELGDCDISAPVKATGALSGEFDWACETGSFKGQVLLSPTNPPAIQALRGEVIPNGEKTE
jgi:CubicO group peptidase (beta-lactamase class C family)